MRVLVLLLLLMAHTALADAQADVLAGTPADDSLLLRLALDPPKGLLVGQQARLNLDLLAPNGWASLATPPRLELPGAWLMRVETQGTRLSETLAGTDYSGQRYQWLLFPQRAGEFTLAPLPLKVSVKTFADGGNEQQQTLTTEALRFNAVSPPGTENISGLITTTALSASQQWQPDSDTLTLGDGIRRQISMRADGIAGMAFAPLQYPALDGVGIYPGEPQLQDRVNRDTLDSGERTETVSYVPEHPGSYTLPDITLRWWDPETQQLRKQILRGRTLSVSAGPAHAGAGSAAGSRAGSGRAPDLALLLALLSGGAALLFWGWRRYGQPRWAQRQQRRARSEAALFQRFVDAANSADPSATINALMHWLDRIEPTQASGQTGHPARLEPFLIQFGGSDDLDVIDQLLRALNKGNNARWQAAKLIATMCSARQRWLQSSQQTPAAHPLLPPLNPARPTP